jgi:predicted HicB family RNase H-like nuclease
MEANGEEIPEPIAEKIYSGKFQVLITPEFHRRLAIEAAQEQVSWNRYVSYKLVS